MVRPPNVDSFVPGLVTGPFAGSHAVDDDFIDAGPVAGGSRVTGLVFGDALVTTGSVTVLIAGDPRVTTGYATVLIVGDAPVTTPVAVDAPATPAP